MLHPQGPDYCKWPYTSITLLMHLCFTTSLKNSLFLQVISCHNSQRHTCAWTTSQPPPHLLKPAGCMFTPEQRLVPHLHLEEFLYFTLESSVALFYVYSSSLSHQCSENQVCRDTGRWKARENNNQLTRPSEHQNNVNVYGSVHCCYLTWGTEIMEAVTECSLCLIIVHIDLKSSSSRLVHIKYHKEEVCTRAHQWNSRKRLSSASDGLLLQICILNI